MKSMSQSKTSSALFMFCYLLSSCAGHRNARELSLMRHVPCSNSVTGESGICTFNWSCVNVAHGVHIGHCVDRFFIGTCCKIKEEDAHYKQNSSLSRVPETTEKDSEMDTPTSLFYRLANAIKKQQTKLISVEEADHPNITFKLTTENKTHDQYPSEAVVWESPINKGNWDYLIISNHNRKPILPDALLPSLFSQTLEPNIDLNSSTQGFYSEKHKTPPEYIFKTTDYHDKTTVSVEFPQNPPLWLDAFHDQRKPVSVHATHDQRKPVGQPTNTHASHDQTKPISTHETFNERKPVIPELQHNIRQPVPLEEAHDQRWPVLDEDSHDERLPTENIFNWVGNISNTENNTISFNEVLSFSQKSKPSTVSDVLTEITHSADPLVNTISVPYAEESTGSSWNGVEHNSIETDFNAYRGNGSIEIKNTLSNISSFISPTYSTTTTKPYNPSYDFSSFDVSRVCGRPRSSTTGRIVGGRKSYTFRWPWMISLQRYEDKKFKHKCGATLLNKFWAATAAHCVDGKLPKDLRLRLGEHNFLRSDELHPHVERRVYVMVVHPEFNPITYESDLALLRFEDPIQYQANIVPVCLPSVMDDITGRIAVVTGWGKLAEEGELPASLHEVYVPIISNTECERMYLEAGYEEAIRDVFVCAGLARGGLDACEGDSGGPMVVKGDKGQWVLVGLTSWGISCAAPKQPGVYTRISEFKNWINGIIVH